MDILEEETNPYIQAFWKWWPDLVNDLRVFRITGGEPLLSKNTFKVLEDLSLNPRPNLEVAINSNLGVSDASFRRFLDLAKDLVKNKKIKMFRLYTSADAWGERAEYIRNGLEFPRFQKNLELFLQEIPEAYVTIMVTFNALSLTSFKKFLVYIRELKERYFLAPGHCPLYVDISYLRHPEYQTIQVLPPSYQKYMIEICEYLEAETATDMKPFGFYFFETMKAQRILEWMRQPLSDFEIERRRWQFYQFFSEHDQRRQTDFLKAFPEMQEFWELCRTGG